MFIANSPSQPIFSPPRRIFQVPSEPCRRNFETQFPPHTHKQEAVSEKVIQNARYRPTLQLWIASRVGLSVNRRLEDRIRELCALAVVTRQDDERELILAELMGALREHNQRLKRKAALKLVEQVDGFQERRA